MKRYVTISLLLSCLTFAQAPAESKKPEKADFLLPDVFSGWQRSATKVGVPEKNNALLKELGVQATQSTTYTRDDRKMTVTATRFADATGAFGAFTSARTPEMSPEKLCSQGASAGKRVIFMCANVFVDVNLDKQTGMTLADMRTLAAMIPTIGGGAAQLPNLNNYFPKELQNNAKFAMGPEGVRAVGSPVPADVINFATSPEVSVSSFTATDGDAKMTLIQYPSQPFAREQIKKIDAWAAQQNFKSIGSVASGDLKLNTYKSRRIGPIVAVVTGSIAESEATTLLEKLHYDAEITQNESTGLEPKNNIGSLVYTSIMLAIIIFSIAVVFGLFFGGFRILAQKFFPGRIVDKPEDIEFIKLNLDQ